MKVQKYLVLLIISSGCSGGSSSTSEESRSCSPYSSSGQSIGSTNVVPITVGCGYVNQPCVAVKICEPGSVTNCTTIDHILLDTGSYGLRLFGCTHSLDLPSQTTGTGREVAECVHYADGSSDWGPVKLADVYMAGEVAANIPIQIVDAGYASVPAFCGSPEYSPRSSGFNGILGVGLLQNDCPSCTIDSTAGYYSCANGSCSGYAAPAAKQVINPIAKMKIGGASRDQNGVLISMNAVGSSNGANGVTGYLYLGVDTVANNASTGTTKYAATANVEFNTTYKGQLYPNSFVDCGSNLWNFADNTITLCTGYLSGLFCPGSTQNLSATPAGGSAVNFSIANANSALSSNRIAYDNLGAYFDPINDSFDWGMPFYYGRDIFHVIQGKSTGNLGAGPAWAWQ